MALGKIVSTATAQGRQSRLTIREEENECEEKETKADKRESCERREERGKS